MAPVPTPPQDITAIENHLRALRTPDDVIARHISRLRQLQKAKQRRLVKVKNGRWGWKWHEVPATDTANPKPKRQQQSKAFSRGQIPKLWSRWRGWP
jgi:hypothetical protein